MRLAKLGLARLTGSVSPQHFLAAVFAVEVLDPFRKSLLVLQFKKSHKFRQLRKVGRVQSVQEVVQFGDQLGRRRQF